MHHTIAITGGTGHLGLNLIHELLEQGYKVKALVRSSHRPIEHKNLIWVHGDLNNHTALKELVKDSFAIIHCASKISVGEYDHDLVYEVNVLGTQNLVQVCTDSAIRFIYVSSSTAVTEPVKDEIFDENRPLRSDKTFYYAWTKAEAEKFVLGQVKSTELDAFIIRPTAIVGPKDLIPSRFGQTILDLSNGQLPFITDGGYNMVDVRDLSKTIINSISQGKKGNAYLTGGEYLSLKDLSKIVNPSKTPNLISIDLLIWLLPLIKVYDRLFKLKWPISKESLITLKNAPKHMDCSKAITELGHQNRPVKETLTDLVSSFNKKS